MKKGEWLTHSEEETRHFAENFARELKPGTILLLEGNLAAGKTTFVQGMVKGLNVPEAVMVHSPTFTIINEYPAKINLVHIDLYRIDHPQQLEELGIEEYLDTHKILAVEWADKAAHYWPKDAIKIRIESIDSHSRRIMIGPAKE